MFLFLLNCCMYIWSNTVLESGMLASSTASLAGAVTGYPVDAYVLTYNPAGLCFLKHPERVSAHLGVTYLQPFFLNIHDVIVQNITFDDVKQTGNVNLPQNGFAAQTFALSVELSQWHHITFGLNAVSPLGYLAAFDTGFLYEPQYVRYGAMLQRPSFQVGLAGSILDQLSVGLGLHTGFAMDATGIVHLMANKTQSSWMHLKGKLKPLFAPVFGIFYSPVGMNVQVGASFKTPLKMRTGIDFDSQMSIISSPISLKFSSDATLYYDPGIASLGMSGYWQDFFGTLQLDYEIWKTYQPPSLLLKKSNDSMVFSDSLEIAVPVRNIFVYRLGVGFNPPSGWSIQAGYAYRPSIFYRSPNQDSLDNLLDPASHLVRLGGGYQWKNIWNTFASVGIQGHIGWQYLQRQNIVKSSTLQVLGKEDVPIGFPSYVAGGSILTAGVQFSVYF